MPTTAEFIRQSMRSMFAYWHSREGASASLGLTCLCCAASRVSRNNNLILLTPMFALSTNKSKCESSMLTRSALCVTPSTDERGNYLAAVASNFGEFHPKIPREETHCKQLSQFDAGTARGKLQLARNNIFHPLRRGDDRRR